MTFLKLWRTVRSAPSINLAETDDAPYNVPTGSPIEKIPDGHPGTAPKDGKGEQVCTGNDELLFEISKSHSNV